MPLKKRIFIFILPICIALSVYLFNERKIYSSPQTTKSFLKSSFSSKGVVNRVINVNLKYDSTESDSDKVEVIAEIRMPFSFTEKLHYKWKLGQNVDFVEGKITGEINGLQKDEIQKIRLTVRGFSKKDNRHIGFEVYGIKDGKNVFGDALIASDFENTFENTVQNVEKIKASEK